MTANVPNRARFPHTPRIGVLTVLLALVSAACATSDPVPVRTATSESTELACGAALPRQETATDLGEISQAGGLVASRRHPGVFWVVGTSRNQLRLSAVSADGSVLGEFPLSADGEVVDIALGPGPDGDLLYLALGAPETSDRQQHTVLQFAEPDPAASAELSPTVLRFSSREPVRVVSLLVDGGDLYLVGAVRRRSIVYQASPGAGIRPLVAVAGIDGLAVDADLSADGEMVAVLTNVDLMIWDRRPDATLAATVASAPCIGRLNDGDLGGVIAFDPAVREVRTIHAALQPAIVSYSLPPAADTGVDLERVGSLAPTVTIIDPGADFTVTGPAPFTADAQVADDDPFDGSQLRWRVEARLCSGTDECEVLDLALESGTPITITPDATALTGSEYVLTVTYVDAFELTATDTITLPIEAPAG